MEYSYRFRLYPNKEQQDLITKTCGCCRFVYNHFLDRRKTVYAATGKSYKHGYKAKAIYKNSFFHIRIPAHFAYCTLFS